MTLCYRCFENYEKNENQREYVTYGIRLEQNEPTEKFEIGDISTDREFVHHIAELLNEYQASPIHAMDIIEDLLIQ